MFPKSILLAFSCPVNKNIDFHTIIQNEICRVCDIDIKQFILHFLDEWNCLVYVSDELMYENLLKRGNIHFRGGSITITHSTNQLSSYVEINWTAMYRDIILDDINKLMKQFADKKFVMYPRSNSLLIECDKSYIEKLVSMFSRKYTVQLTAKEVLIHQVKLSELQLLKCSWSGKSSISETCTSLMKLARSFSSSLQGILFSRDEVPCIISDYYEHDHPVGVHDIYLLVPTKRDVDMLLMAECIELHGGKLSFSGTPTATEGDIFIFWLYSKCPLLSREAFTQMNDKLRLKLSERFSTVSAATTFVGKFFMVNSQLDEQLLSTAKQQAYETIVYEDKMEIGWILRPHINSLIEKYSKQDYKPPVCIITDTAATVMSILASLRLQKFSNVAIITASENEPPTTSFASTVMKLSELKDVDPVLDIPPITIQSEISPTYGEVVMMGSKKKAVTTTKTYTLTSDLQCLSIATHFKHLITWANEAASPNMNMQQSEISNQLIFGEETFSKQYHPEDIYHTSVTIVTDSKSKLYQLTVSGDSLEAVQRRLLGLKNMVMMMLKNRKTYPLSSWDPHHRECIIGSRPLTDAERRIEATALFHINEGTIVLAEVVALSIQKHRNMKKFLESLQPKYLEKSIPFCRLLDIKDKHWAQIKTSFATKIEYQSISVLKGHIKDKKALVPIKIWGFESYLDMAIQEIFKDTQLFPLESVETAILSEIKPASPTSTKYAPISTPSKITTGCYIFQDREAGIFYSSFESYFRKFIKHSFDVDVDDIHPCSQDAFLGLEAQSPMHDSSSIHNQLKTPALKIDFSGSSTNVRMVRGYVEKLNAANLSRYQIYYPQTSAVKYKEICDEKFKEDRLLKTLRARYYDNSSEDEGNEQSSPIQSTSKSDGTVDPLEALGFVNIRIKPPLHSRGMKRMNFPADVTVTVCGPIMNSDQQQCLSDTLNSMKSVRSEYFDIEIKVPGQTELAKQLTLRSSRQDFVNQFKLVGIRWEEGHKGTGGMGLAHIWTQSIEDLHRLLQYVGNSIASLESKFLPDDFVIRFNQSKLIEQTESMNQSLESREDVDTDIITQAIATEDMLAIGPHALSSPQPTSYYDDTMSQVAVGSILSTIGYEDANAYELDVWNSCGSSESVEKLTSTMEVHDRPDSSLYDSSSPRDTRAQVEQIVSLPHPTLKYLLGIEPVRSIMGKLVEEAKALYDVEVVAPALTASGEGSDWFKLIGTRDELDHIVNSITSLLRSVAIDICSLCILMNSSQYDRLVGGKLSFQKMGIECIWSPLPQDRSDVCCCYDLRYYGTNEYSSNFMSYWVWNKSRGKATEVILTYSKEYEESAESCILMLDDWSVSIGCHDSQRTLALMNNNVIGTAIHKKEKSPQDGGQLLLQIKPNYQVENSRHAQISSFITSLLKALEEANNRQVREVCIPVPVALAASFSQLSADMIRSLTVETTVGFFMRCVDCHISEVILLDSPNIHHTAEITSPTQLAAGPTLPNRLLPGAGNRMSLTSMVLMEKYNRDNECPGGIQLNHCNIPLPPDMSVESISKPCPFLGVASRQKSDGIMLMMRGLAETISKGIEVVENCLGVVSVTE